MDFFAYQDRARRHSVFLLLWFVLAVCVIVCVVYLLLRWGLRLEDAFNARHSGQSAPPWWDAQLFAWVALGVGGLILGGSLYKSIVFGRGGGHAVAKALGARLVARSSQEPYERELVNIVDEMAIASGIVPPRVYILERETGLNAFAAGTHVSRAAVIVTRGLLECLDRDELQGVVAHEFGHILNGDMRLNLRLAGLLHGILLISLLGRMLLMARPHGTSALRRSGGHSGNSALPMMGMGLGLLVIGSIGLLFGHIIKAAISRQREYLADASAAQFTRYPEALARALDKIGGGGSKIDHPNAAEFSHMFISANSAHPAHRDPVAAWFATHPPIEKRIARLAPGGIASSAHAGGKRPRPVRKMPPLRPKTAPDEPLPPADADAALAVAAAISVPSRAAAPASSASSSRLSAPPPDLDAIFTGWFGGKKTPAPAAASRAAAGAPAARSESPVPAHRWLEYFPGDMAERLHQSDCARAAVLALLLSGTAATRRQQCADITHRFDAHAAQSAAEYAAWLDTAHAALRLPLLDIALSTLAELPAGARSYLCDTCGALLQRETEIPLPGNIFCSLIARALRPQKENRRAAKSPATLRLDAAHLLAWLALAGHGDDWPAARQAWHAARSALPPGLALQWPFAESGNEKPPQPAPQQLHQVLQHLAATRATFRKQLMDACTRAILHDGHISALEAALLRAVCQALDCPLPPDLAYASLPPVPAAEGKTEKYEFDWKAGLREDSPLEELRRSWR